MASNTSCARCKVLFPPTHFVGVSGRPTKTCASCRKRPVPTAVSPFSPNVQTPHLVCRSRSSSPSARSPSTASPSHGRTRRDDAHFASAASVRALETRFGRLEHSLDSQLTQLFDAIRALQPPTDPAPALLPSQPALQVSPPLPALPPTPRVQPVTSTALTSVGNQNTTAGELPLLSVSRCFPWVPADVVALVERDQLRPEQLVKLRNPESRVSQAAVQSTSLNIEGGQLRISEESAESRTSAFVKAIPSIAALAQVWLVYVAIRARHTNNWELNDALLSHLEQLIEFNQLYTWRAVADYHLAVCRLRFGTGAVIEWSHYDPQIAGRVLLPYHKTVSLPPTRGEPSSSSRHPSSNQRSTRLPRTGSGASSDPCRKSTPVDAMPVIRQQGYHQHQQRSRQEGELVVSTPTHSGDMPRPQPVPLQTAPTPLPVPPTTAPLRSGPTPAPSPSLVPPTVAPLRPVPPTVAPARTEQTSAPLSRPSLDALTNGIVDMSPDSASTFLSALLSGTPPPPRPNTLCERPIFDATDVPATVGTLQLRYWSQFLDLYPDQAFATQLRGALRHGVKLGYDGPLRHNARPDVNNLPMDSADVQHLRREIETRMQEGRLRHVANPSDVRLVCSPVGVVPKPHSDKRRTIYHLSHPRKPGARLPSVNDGIHPSFVTIRYESLDAIMEFIREHPSASLWKADLEDAFRHVIVSESDARLMGIHFDRRHYQECALAFGGRSSPFLFNLFAEFLHWLTTFALQSVTPSSTSHSEVSHYLDDFFGASDASANPATPVQVLSLASAALGFRISRKKTLWDTTRLEVLGIELDSVAQTASITHQRRQRILQLCGRIVDRGRASLLELQQVAGHLQFVTRVAPHGRAFLCRLYDAVRSHYKAPFGRRISKATRSELLWWIATLNTWDGVSLLQPSPLVVEHVWTDASKRCIGAHLGTMDEPVAAFSHELARRHRRKDIRFLEALAVLEALRRFAPLWLGPRRVVVHVDNENVKYGLRKGSIRDPQTQALFRAIFSLCLQQHIDLVPIRVSSEANILADALSRRRFAFVQQHYPRAYALLRFNAANTAPSPLPPLSRPQASRRQQPSSSGTDLPPAHAHVPQRCASTSPPSPLHNVATPSRPQRHSSSNGWPPNTLPTRLTAQSSVTSPSSSLGTSTSASPQLFSTPNAWPESFEASSESLVLRSLSPSSPSPFPSCANSSVPCRQSAPHHTTVGCSVPPFASPLLASSAQESSLGKRKTPTICSQSARSALPATGRTRPSPSPPARPTRFGRASPSQHRRYRSALAPSLLSTWCAGHARRQHPSSSSKTAALLPGLASSTPYANALRPPGSSPRPTLATPSAVERRPGLPRTVLTTTPSVDLAVGVATASVDTSTSPLPIALPPPRRRSTPTPQPPCHSTPSPGATSNCLSLGSPVLALQPQLMTVTPCGTPLAHHVATAGSSQATLPS
ncbi:uncharacterized protein UTRI_10299 [Ustilago trichophora]|uniref:Reverse transcriptase domain-containing protein n=1 Tax=Ustilago trichophora TaxID=86804 RepID=A0A5C3ENA7_9BASI|nr:uncharacterized protein UTRI_10299 [Ustilago trichophora]